MESSVKVDRISVKKDRISVLVRLSAHAPRTTWPRLVQEAELAFPGLLAHACVNDVGPMFGDVAECTSVPHMLEHLVIHLQVVHPQTPAHVMLAGTTEWLDEAQGLARVEVNYADDLVALGALQEALAFLNERMVDCV